LADLGQGRGAVEQGRELRLKEKVNQLLLMSELRMKAEDTHLNNSHSVLLT